MKKKDVKLGEVYIVRVGRTMALVRIDRASPFGGWEGTNLATGRLISIRGVQRLRRKALDKDYELLATGRRTRRRERMMANEAKNNEGHS